MKVKFILNKQNYELDIHPFDNLHKIMFHLRLDLSLSCLNTDCARCLVLFKNKAVPSCLLFAYSLDKESIFSSDYLFPKLSIKKKFHHYHFPSSYYISLYVYLIESLALHIINPSISLDYFLVIQKDAFPFKKKYYDDISRITYFLVKESIKKINE